MTHLGDLLSAYLDGELTPGGRSAADRHLADCLSCREELEGISSARAALRALPMLEPPEELLPASDRPPTRISWWRRVAWAAAAVVAGLLGIGMLTGGQSSPAFDLDTLNQRHTARVVVDPGISTIRGSVGAP